LLGTKEVRRKLRACRKGKEDKQDYRRIKREYREIYTREKRGRKMKYGKRR